MAIEVPFLPEHLNSIVEDAITEHTESLGRWLSDVPGIYDQNEDAELPSFAVIGGVQRFTFGKAEFQYDNLRPIGWTALAAFLDGKHLVVQVTDDGDVIGTGLSALASALPGMIARAAITWGHAETTGPLQFIEVPSLYVWAVRVPGAGVILDEGWVYGNHGLPMSEDDFLIYLAGRLAEKHMEE
jgi:hypothetical protein